MRKRAVSKSSHQHYRAQQERKRKQADKTREAAALSQDMSAAQLYVALSELVNVIVAAARV